jgi:hypothetical protein
MLAIFFGVLAIIVPQRCPAQVVSLSDAWAVLSIPPCDGNAQFPTVEKVSDMPECARHPGAWFVKGDWANRRGDCLTSHP